jgi:hypothetical protein
MNSKTDNQKRLRTLGSAAFSRSMEKKMEKEPL